MYIFKSGPMQRVIDWPSRRLFVKETVSWSVSPFVPVPSVVVVVVRLVLLLVGHIVLRLRSFLLCQLVPQLLNLLLAFSHLFAQLYQLALEFSIIRHCLLRDACFLRHLLHTLSRQSGPRNVGISGLFI